MQQSNMAILLQNGRPEMFYGLYLSRYSTDNRNLFCVYYRSKDKESKFDILYKYEIQLGGSNLRLMPRNIIFYKVVMQLFI